MTTADAPTAKPNRKVGAQVLAGAVMTIVAFVVETASAVDLPGAVVAAGVTLVSFGLSYVVREPREV